MLPGYFKNYLDDLGTVHQHNTRQKAKKTFFTLMLELSGAKLQRAALEIWEKLPLELKIFYKIRIG